MRLWDSGAICAYLADKYPSVGLAPPLGHVDRGRYLQWLMYPNAVIEPAMAEKFSGAAPNSLAHGWGSWPQMLEVLNAGLCDSQWILGERFSAADVLLGSACLFMRDFKMIGDQPVLLRYVERCVTRPAAQRAAAAEQQAI